MAFLLVGTISHEAQIRSRQKLMEQSDNLVKFLGGLHTLKLSWNVRCARLNSGVLKDSLGSSFSLIWDSCRTSRANHDIS